MSNQNAAPKAPEVEELYVSKLQAIWFMADDIVEKESTSGRVTVRLRGRYQGSDAAGNADGYPAKVINVWGLTGKEMRQLIKFAKANPFSCVQLIGQHDERATLLAGGNAGSNIESLNNAKIRLIKGTSDWMVKELDEDSIIEEKLAKPISRKMVEERRAARGAVVIEDGVMRRQNAAILEDEEANELVATM